jgi:predicted dehydrogenase
MKTYKTALIGCSRMGAFIDNETPSDHPAYSHAAGYEACARTEMVACADLSAELMEQVGIRYGVPKQKQYLDYREMIEAERPDILSIATQPAPRAQIFIHAAEAGVPAIYIEKAMAASLAEAETMMQAAERHGVFVNMGTNRRWDPGYDAMHSVIDSGRLGKLVSVISHTTGPLFNSASHMFDMLMRFNNDVPVTSVQANLTGAEQVISGERLLSDPAGQGTMQCENGVTLYALETGRAVEVEAVCERGTVEGLNNGTSWHLRESGGLNYLGRHILVPGEFPAFEAGSSTVGLIEDLVHSLDTGEAPRGGARLAYANTELIFAFVESHARGGQKVELPLAGSNYRLEVAKKTPRPTFEPKEA